MALQILTIDAFTSRAFGGNPAGVCLLPDPADPSWMQQVATEMNLSETAFVVPGDGAFGLRWFTPTVEVELCGHATLASAHALWETGRAPADARIAFDTASGRLTAARDGDRIAIELPAIPVAPCELPSGLADALGTTPRECHTSSLGAGENGNYLALVDDEATVRGLAPDFRALAAIPAGVIVTAPAAEGGRADFVSRYFAVPYGIDEDPVTGSAHCSLAPYWAARLGRTRLRALQVSRRGGDLAVQVQSNRVTLAGHAVTVMRGELLSHPSAT